MQVLTQSIHTHISITTGDVITKDASVQQISFAYCLCRKRMFHNQTITVIIITLRGTLQYRITYLIKMSRQVSKTQDRCIEFSNRSEIWHVPRRNCWWAVWQVSEPHEHYHIRSRGFKASRDLAVRSRLCFQPVELPNWWRIFGDFTQETTLHGIRYTRGESGFRGRR